MNELSRDQSSYSVDKLKKKEHIIYGLASKPIHKQYRGLNDTDDDCPETVRLHEESRSPKEMIRQLLGKYFFFMRYQEMGPFTMDEVRSFGRKKYFVTS